MLWHHSLSVGVLKLFEQVEILDSTNILFYGVSPLNLSNSIIELYSVGMGVVTTLMKLSPDLESSLESTKKATV